MDANDLAFRNRLRRIQKQHRHAADGYIQLVERDGILVPTPRAKVKVGFPFRWTFFVILGVLAFKGLLLVALGADTYEAKLTAFENGSVFEQVAGWVMQADPVTLWMAEQIALFI